ncbi:MAG: hypothetical protein HS127_16540 [Planctomycetia bacterium]|nr:hypothetical protein [Planctomycetia bacterium]
MGESCRHRARVVKAGARDIFLKETVILYDLTNTYFEGSKRSKVAGATNQRESRNDCPLITLSLTVDEEDFPSRARF